MNVVLISLTLVEWMNRVSGRRLTRPSAMGAHGYSFRLIGDLFVGSDSYVGASRDVVDDAGLPPKLKASHSLFPVGHRSA